MPHHGELDGCLGDLDRADRAAAEREVVIEHETEGYVRMLKGFDTWTTFARGHEPEDDGVLGCLEATQTEQRSNLDRLWSSIRADSDSNARHRQKVRQLRRENVVLQSLQMLWRPMTVSTLAR